MRGAPSSTGDGGAPPSEKLARLADITAAGVDLTRPIVTSCGSGVNAAILTLALDTIGVGSAVYDGSWTEWGGRDDMPIATGSES